MIRVACVSVSQGNVRRPEIRADIWKKILVTKREGESSAGKQER